MHRGCMTNPAGHRVKPRDPSREESTMGDYANDVLVGTDWLAENIDNTRLLDGGRKKWELEGRELTKDPAKVVPTSGYKVAKADDEIRAFRDYIKDNVLGAGGYGLVDVRSPEEFRGELLAPAHLPQ